MRCYLVNYPISSTSLSSCSLHAILLFVVGFEESLYFLTLGRTRWWGEVNATRQKVFLSFFLEAKTLAPDVFSRCSFIPRADFQTSLVMVSCYGYEI